MMQLTIGLLTAFFLGGVAAACALWAGASQGAPISFALGGLALAIGAPVVIAQDANWCVSGNEPALRWRQND